MWCPGGHRVPGVPASPQSTLPLVCAAWFPRGPQRQRLSQDLGAQSDLGGGLGFQGPTATLSLPPCPPPSRDSPFQSPSRCKWSRPDSCFLFSGGTLGLRLGAAAQAEGRPSPGSAQLPAGADHALCAWLLVPMATGAGLPAPAGGGGWAAWPGFLVRLPFRAGVAGSLPLLNQDPGPGHPHQPQIWSLLQPELHPGQPLRGVSTRRTWLGWVLPSFTPLPPQGRPWRLLRSQETRGAEQLPAWLHVVIQMPLCHVTWESH